MKKKRRVWALFLALIMVLSTAIPSYAADVSDSTESSLEEQYEAKAAEVVRGFGFDDSTSDYDKVVAIQTWISQNVHYEYYWNRVQNGLSTDGYKKHTENPSNKYGAMLDHYALCSGYTEVFDDLCYRTGLFSVSVGGILGVSGLHAWNIVGIDGENYYIDPTNIHDNIETDRVFLFGTNSAIGSFALDSAHNEYDKKYNVKEYGYRYYHSSCNGSHSFEKSLNSEKATCTKDGYDIYYCTNSGCHAYYKVGYTAPGHHWDDGVVTKAPTCTEEGIKKYTCVNCKDQILGGNSYKEESIPKLGHDIDYTQPMNDTRLCFQHKTLGWGSVQFPCKREGCTYLETKYGSNAKYKIDHDYVVISDTATCTEAGTLKKMCVRERTDGGGVEYNGKMVCGKTVTTTSPAKGHQNTEVRNASSTYTGDTYCKDCGVLVAKGHSITHHWDNGTVKTKPTCTVEGEMLYTCTDENCSETKTEPIPATGHKNKEIRNKKDATCTENGYTGDTYCVDCDTKLESGKETKALGHDYKKTSETPSTCKDHGTATFTCTRCNDKKTEQLELSDEHSWDEGVVTTAPTCTEAGVKMFTCTVCKKTRTEAVKETGHQHKEVRNKKDTTCTAKGYTGDTWCTDCNTVVETGKETPALGHDFKETGRTEATCKDTGLVTYKCSRCGEPKTDVLEKTDKHTWNDGKTIVAPKCETAGTIRYTCTVCSVTKDKTVEATGHQHTVVRNQYAATCTTNGYTGDTYCTDCSKKLQGGSSIPAKGHSWNSGVVTKNATCTAAGVKTYTCTTCRATKTENIPATGHRHTQVRNAYGASCTGNGYTGDTYCTDCGAKLSSGAWVNAVGHSYGAPYVTAWPSAVAEGRMAHSCTRCGYTETWATARIAATGNFNATNVPLKVKKSFTLKVENMAAGDWVASWRSSNTKVATVNGAGKVTARKKTGKTTITAVLASGRVISTTVKVQKGNVNTSRVVLNSPNSLTLKVKQGAQVSAVRYPVTSQQGIRYSTSNKKVATVNKKGRITAKKAGKAKIYVKSGKKKATVNVRVIK